MSVWDGKIELRGECEHVDNGVICRLDQMTLCYISCVCVRACVRVCVCLSGSTWLMEKRSDFVFCLCKSDLLSLEHLHQSRILLGCGEASPFVVPVEDLFYL